MKEKLESWCYGGTSKAFFKEKCEEIHQYNTKMTDRLLMIMTFIVGTYLVVSTGTGLFSKYVTVYAVCYMALLFLFCTFKLAKKKSILFTKIYIVLFSLVIFSFVCVLGTVFEPNTRSTLFIVYVLVLPMLFVIPTHHMFGFLFLASGVFSGMALQIKVLPLAQMDIAHVATCLVIGIFLSHHILESRMALYVLNNQLDKRLQAQEEQLLESRIAILLSQIQPHFLYNTLTVICGLCDEDPKEAKKVTVEFAEYLRHNMDTLNQRMPVPFEDELGHTQLYLSIEKKRFEEKLHVVYDIQAKAFFLPPLTVQPLVENAVKHGIVKRKKGGTVTIATRERDSGYEITISDDGLGFEPGNLAAEPGRHIGIENVRHRLRSLCAGTLTIESEVGRGTTAVIRIPTKEREQFER